MPILEQFRNIDSGLRPGQKWQFFCKKQEWPLKKENVSYSAMYIKNGLRMIRLSNVQYEKTMQIAAQQTQILLCPGIAYMRIQWKSCKVCCAKKHSIQCNILKYLRKMKESAINRHL